METEASRLTKYNRTWAVVVGVGLALSPIHNLWLTKLVTTDSEVGFFIPAFGTAVWFMAALVFVIFNWEQIKENGWGDKKVVVPLLILVGAIGLSGITADSWIDKFTPLLMGLAMFALYLVVRYLTLSRLLGSIKAPVIVIVGVAAVTSIVLGIVIPESRNSGLITNYCALAGLIVLGGLLIDRKWLWLAVGPILVAIFLIGALEGLFAVAVLAAIALARRDWGRRVLLSIGVALIAAGIWIGTGNAGTTYQHATQNLNALFSIGSNSDNYEGSEEAVDAALSGRWEVIRDALHDVRWLGHGYVLTPSPDKAGDRRPVHNMPLLAVDQVGPIGGAAWLWVAVFCLVKTRWKYLWAAVLATSVFDYYIWTQFAPWFWAFVGMSTASSRVVPDLIFRKNTGVAI